MAKKVQEELDTDRGRTRLKGAASGRELLEEAQGLAVQIERLLTSPCDFAESDTFRIRLARAHTLSLLDQLSELVGTREPAHDPVRGPLAEDGSATSSIRTAWR